MGAPSTFTRTHTSESALRAPDSCGADVDTPAVDDAANSLQGRPSGVLGLRSTEDTPRAVIRVLIANEHAIIRDGIRLLCTAHADLCVIGEAVDGETAVDRAEELQPDVVVMDVTMPRMNGMQATALLRQRAPEVKVLAFTRHKEDLYLRELLAAGARGYALTQSSSADLLTGIRTVAQGRQYLDPALTSNLTRAYLGHAAGSEAPELSRRETEVLQLTAWGYRNTDIAGRLKISVKTVEVHKANGLQKLGIPTRIGLTRFALLRGWFQTL